MKKRRLHSAEMCPHLSCNSFGVVVASLLIVLGLGVPRCFAAEDPKPLSALLITGGCCHDYDEQKKILPEGISARANVEWTVVQEGGTSTQHRVSVYAKENWTEGYDVIVHNECFSDEKDAAWLERIVKPHREGVPAMVIHCAMHCYRAPNDEWFKFVGVTSHRHGSHFAHEVKNLQPEHPIMRGFPASWMTPKEELYNIAKVWPTTTPLAVSHSHETKVDETDIWINTYGKGRVFGTTIGHYNHTMEQPVYLDVVARGLLWACGKLGQDGKPLPGYGPTGQRRGEGGDRAAPQRSAASTPALLPVVEVEEDVYSYEPANNGAGPMWCGGSTCLVRVGEDVFASGLETLKDVKPLNNCRWLFFQRGPNRWEQVLADPTGRTREPSPLVGFADGRVFLSGNPTLVPLGSPGGGPAQPEILQFSARDPKAPFKRLFPEWEGDPKFTEHSYRSFAADGPNRELILFQNIGYTHAEWAFLDRAGKWAAKGQLKWPWGAEYDKPQPIRACYPNVALKDRAVHFCGVSDIVEPYEKFRSFKKQLTGRDWDYDFRRLFYAWSPDITTGKFHDWVELASRDKTCGWIFPADLWVAPDGTAHILWTERALDERLREKFFPDERQSHALNYALVREGKVVSRRALVLAEEGKSNEIVSAARFHVTPDDRLFVFCYVSGTDAAGKQVSENRLIQIQRDGTASAARSVPFKQPFTSFFTATVRAGSAPSMTLDLLGTRVGAANTISYARVRLQ